MPISEFPTLRLNGNQSALKNALVEFFTHSKASSRILRLLSTKRKPVGFNALRDEIHFSERWRPNLYDLPASAIHAALCITQAAGLVRLTRRGFSITEVGREVQRRIEPEECAEMLNVRAVRSISGNTRHLSKNHPHENNLL